MAISLFSFFAGVGMLDLGFESIGLNYNIVFVNERKKSFLEAYKYTRTGNNIQEPIYGYHCTDINNYLMTDGAVWLTNSIRTEHNNNNIVGFIGGPPCPDFSVGGKNLGKAGENGILARSYVDLITSQNPDFFLFENVRGLVKTSKHRAYFDELKQLLVDADYVISDKILNSLSFSVPQDRDRVLMIGIKNRHEIFLPMLDTHILDFPWLQYATFDASDVKNMPWPEKQAYIANSRRRFVYDVPENLTVEHWFKQNDVSHHPNGRDVFKVKKGRNKMLEIDEGDTSRKSFKRLHRWKYSPTAAYGNNEVHLHPYKTRRLSVAETMAIQSLPAWFSLPQNMSLTDKFKVIGNGVPYLMSSEIAKTIDEFLQEVFRGVNLNG